MKSILHVLSFESKIVWRSQVLKLLLGVILAAGIYAIYFGKQELNKQERRILQVEEYEEQQFDSLMDWVQLDSSIDKNRSSYFRASSPTGYGRYKHFTWYKSKETPAAAGMCLGQRDLYPAYYGFNVTDLARQINVSELENPMKLLTGNFDLSYVIIFLCPLLIIGLFYDLYAKEKEGRTLPLLLAHSISLNKILITKGLFRLIIVWAAVGFLVLLGFIVNGISLAEHSSLVLEWFSISYAYTLFWTLLMSLVLCLRQNSSTSAMIGFGLWLIFTLISPALINLFVQANTSVPNRTAMINEIRNLNNDIWASPKSHTLNQFYKEYPSYNDGDTIMFDKFYYASFTLIDKKANLLQASYEQQVSERNELSRNWTWLAPGALVHDKLSQISGTNRKSHQEFISQVHDFHESIKEVYYQKIFREELFTLSDLQNLRKGL